MGNPWHSLGVMSLTRSSSNGKVECGHVKTARLVLVSDASGKTEAGARSVIDPLTLIHETCRFCCPPGGFTARLFW